MLRWMDRLPVVLRALLACIALVLGGGATSSAAESGTTTEYRVTSTTSTTATPRERRARAGNRVQAEPAGRVHVRRVARRDVVRPPATVFARAPDPVPVFLRHCALLR